MPGAYDPDRLIGRIGTALVSPTATVRGFHIFTFNQLKLTENWRQAHVDLASGWAQPV